jgi:hypothetical protein
MDAIDRFAESYLGQWERLATVRSTKRYALSGDIAGESLFPARLQPLCDVPAVGALGPAARRFILIQTCYWFMNEIALLETDVVSQLASDLANRPHRIDLSAPVRQVALTIAVDEAYHAFAAREFNAQVEATTGIRPVSMQRHCGLETAVAATQRATSEDLHDDLRVLMLCIAENSITSEILGMTEETPPDNPFHIVSEEHLVDERRHSGYFQHLLKHYWAGLDDERREALGALVPAFLERFLYQDVWSGWTGAVLAGAGMDAVTAERMVGERRSKSFPRTEHPMARNVMRLLDHSGLLAHAPTRAALTREGWIVA